jgi:hypothetical protein
VKQNCLHFIYGLFLLGLLWACSSEKPSAAEPNAAATPDKVLARVGDKQLLMADVQGVLPAGISHADSMQQLSRYAEAWVRQELMLQKALSDNKNLPELAEKQVEDYKNTLHIQYFTEKYATEKLDTNIKAADIEAFYQNNQSNFVLRSPVVKALWVVLPSDAPKVKNAVEWLKKNNAASQQELKSYCVRFAQQFRLQDSVWVSLDELVKNTPLAEIKDKNELVRENSFLQKEDDAAIYLLKINNYKISGQVAPLAYVQSQIKGIILNQRKSGIINALSDDVYKQAQKQQEFEILVKP